MKPVALPRRRAAAPIQLRGTLHTRVATFVVKPLRRLRSSRAGRASKLLAIICAVGLLCYHAHHQSARWRNAESVQQQALNVAPTTAGARAQTATAAVAPPQVSEAYGKLPQSFEANQGQTDARVRYFSRGPGYALFLTPAEAVLALRRSSEPHDQKLPDDHRLPAPSAVAADVSFKAEPSVQQPPDVLRLKFVGSNPAAQISAEGATGARINYLHGNDAARWRTDVPTYTRIRYRELYPGIDLLFYGNQQQFEYDLQLAPGARADEIKLRFDGAQDLKLDPAGGLVLRLRDGEVQQPQPRIYQEVHGRRREVAGAYVLHGPREVGIKVGAYDAARPLVIDPVLAYSTYLGGNGNDRGFAIAVDEAGNAYVTGTTTSTDFPVVGAIQNTHPGFDNDLFIAKLKANGSALVYATYLGGSAYEQGNSIAVDQTGQAYVTGYTTSTDFPTLGALQATLKGLSNAIAVKLNAAGDALEYATYLGGGGYNGGNSIALDAGGNAYIAGSTTAKDFPTVNPIQANRQGSFAFKSADGGSSWSGIEDGLQGFNLFALKVDPNTPTRVYAATDTGLYQSTDGGSSWHVSHPVSARVLALAPSNPAVIYAADVSLFRSTDGGASWTDTNFYQDYITSLVVDPTNPLTVYAGALGGVYKSTNGGSSWTHMGPSQGLFYTDIGQLAINPSNPAILYANVGATIYKTTNGGTTWTQASNGLQPSTYISFMALAPNAPDTLYAALLNGIYKTTDGGLHWTLLNSTDGPASYNLNALVVAPNDANTVYAAGYYTYGVYKSTDGGNTWQLGHTGYTSRTVLSLEVAPTKPANVYAGGLGCYDVFVAKLNASGSALLYSTYLGGSEIDIPYALAISPDGSAYVGGIANSSDFPTAQPLQATLNGLSDGFIVKLNPAGTSLDFATYLGGSAAEYLYGLALDADSNVYVTGQTLSSDFPTVNAFQAAPASVADAFVTKLNSSGSALIYSTYLGGSRDDTARSIAVGANGAAYVVGFTASTNFPVVGPVQAAQGGPTGSQDAFVTQLNSSGNAVQFSTYLGGSGNDQAYGVALNAAGDAYVTGVANSNNFPLQNPLQATFRSGEAFVVRLGILADLALTMSGSHDPVLAGSNLTYTLTVKNNGPSPATNVVVTDNLPASVTPGTITTTQGTCSVSAATVLCPVGDLAAQASAVVTINVMPPRAGAISNVASVQGHEPDPVATNNSATVNTTVSSLPTIYGQMTDADGQALADVALTLSGAQAATTQSDSDGRYRFINVTPGGPYTVTPHKAGYTFTPLVRSFDNVQQDTPADFRADPCAYSLAPTNQSVSGAGGVVKVNVTANGDCPWSATSSVDWIRITSGAAGAGSGTVELTVAPTNAPRTGRVTIAGQVFVVWQEFQSCDTAAFQQVRHYQLSILPTALVTADFNHDGKPDLAALQTLQGEDKVAILLGNGVGGFNAPSYASVGDSARALAAGDLNNDGQIDLVVVDLGNVELLWGHGDGTFSAPQYFHLSSRFHYFANVADFNGDGKADLAVAYEDANNTTVTSILLGDGTGNFSAPQFTFAGGITEIADFNNDGALDLATLPLDIALTNNSHTVSIRLGDGTGHFSAPINTDTGISYNLLRAQDFNGDGKLDLVAGTGAVLIGNGAGGFGPPIPVSGGNLYSYLFGVRDFNNDGKPDLLVSDLGGLKVSLFLGDGTGHFNSTPDVPFGAQPFSPTVADFNGDGRPDLAVADYNSDSVAVLLNACHADPGVSISGRVTDQSSGLGLGYPNGYVYLSSARLGKIFTQTDSNGNYSFRNLARDDDYTLTAFYSGYNFPTLSVQHPATDQVVNFSGTLSNYKIFGRLAERDDHGVAGVPVQLSGFRTATTQTDANGNYAFTDLPQGQVYTVTLPTATDLDLISPNTTTVRLGSDLNFSPLATRRAYVVGGRITLASGNLLSGITINLSGAQSATAVSDQNGNYLFTLLAGYNYTLMPIANNYTFSPATRSFYEDGHQANMDFTATPVPAVVQLSAANYSVGEGEGHASVTVTRTGDTSGAVTVDYRTSDTDTFTIGCADTVNNHGSAFARCDFATVVGTLQFAAGETSKTISIPIIDDAYIEGPETFKFALSNPTGATLGAVATATIMIQDNDTTATANPIFTTPFFVRQQYLDFLSREPDTSGFNAWTNLLNNCSDVNNNPQCDRLTVSQSFFQSQEFQLKGFYVYRFYRVAFNRLPQYGEIVPDMSFVAGNTAQEVFQRKAQLAVNFTRRPDFQSAYGPLANSDYVSTLLGRYQLTQITTPDPAHPDGATKVTLDAVTLTNQLGSGTLTRAQVLRAIADSDEVAAAEFNQAFVAMQYYGYLRRTPEPSGYQNWLTYLNAHPTDTRTMVNGFVNSQEYKLRFGSPNQ